MRRLQRSISSFLTDEPSMAYRMSQLQSLEGSRRRRRVSAQADELQMSLDETRTYLALPGVAPPPPLQGSGPVARAYRALVWKGS